jgi:hypothetical protein
MRPSRFAALVLAGTCVLAASDSSLPPHRQMEKRAAGKRAFIGAALGAATQQAENSPREWGRGWAGFGKRFASSFGKNAVKCGIEVTVGTIRHEELGYHRSGKEGFRPRLQYALLSTVITRKTTTGEKTFASGSVSGAVGAGFISRLWQPLRLHTVGSGLGSAGVSLGIDAGIHVTQEFWPEIRHPRRARDTRAQQEH